MTINLKQTSVLALLFNTGLAIAGTVGPVESADLTNGFYIEGAAGWTYTNWRPAFNYIFPSQTSARFSNLNGGFTAGGDVGYKLNRYFSIEVGALSLPTTKYAINSAGVFASTRYTANDVGSISNWLIDFAGKVSFPVAPISGLEAFGKFGATYRAGTYKDQEIFNGSRNVFIQTSVFNNIEPILGGGLQYHINEHWLINGQYLFTPYGIIATTILGPTLEDHGPIPAAQIVTGGIAYYF